jgi:lipopolysaccharide/colanic/teichoic acid biosynthesis glycosyltransferase
LAEKVEHCGKVVKLQDSNNNRSPSLPTVSGEDRILLREESFHAVISLERKRTERSHRPFLLVLLDVQGIVARDRHNRKVVDVLSALSASIRDTDVSGWYKNNCVIGILFTEIGAGALRSIVGTMLARVNGILYSTLTFEEFVLISISHYVFPEEWDHDIEQRPSHPTLYPDVSQREKRRRVFSVIKRTIDVTGSGIGLILGAPLFVAIALAICLSSKGPVFYRQQRVGRYGTPFVFLKFRSMHVDNDTQVHKQYVKQLIAGQVEPQPSAGSGQGVYKLTNDPRVTKVGAFLRRTSLDELPQLWNVLKGEMSLVGPRPAIPYEVEAYQIWHRRRVLEAKPGITGLWQVSGRSRVKFDEMVRLDVRYAMGRSVWLDLKILLLTPWSVIIGEGAY